MSMDCRYQKAHLLQKIKNEGNHQHNMEVKEAGRGFLHVARVGKNPDPNNFLPCDLCLLWVTRNRLYRHTCLEPERKLSISRSVCLMLTSDSQMTPAMVSVLSGLRGDNLGRIARHDDLILKVLHFKTSSTQWKVEKTRDQLRKCIRNGARLLPASWKFLPKITLWDLLVPKNFDCIVEATKALTKSAEGKDIPDIGLKKGHFVNLCIKVKCGSALQNRQGSEEVLKDMDDLARLMKNEWGGLCVCRMQTGH